MDIKIEDIKKSICSALSNDFTIYPDSFRSKGDYTCFILKNLQEKYLGTLGEEKQTRGMVFSSQLGRDISTDNTSRYIIRLFKRNDENLKKLLVIFPELYPSPLDMNTSFGVGDRLGNANAAHIKVAEKQKGVLPVLAQQSVRELSKTKKDFKMVIAQSIWNILQEGYQGKWGADADHIKEKKYFIEAAEAGMTMYTLDTSDYLNEKVIYMTVNEIRNEHDLNNEYIKKVKKKYLDKKIGIGGKKIYFDEDTLVRLALVYGNAIKFTKDIFQLLKTKLERFDYEVSFDETNTVTTPEAHYFIAEEMRRLGINFTSIALRFPGTFEKGIDYIGDIKKFDRSINIHGLICRKLRGYKLSLHSGSDKLSIYPSFSRNTQGIFHIKTSGTSWLEALRVVASVDPSFFRELFIIAIDSFEENKKAYHINLDIGSISASIENIQDKNLPKILDDTDLRRVFHIAYGVILNIEKQHLMKLLFENEEKYYGCSVNNF